MIRILDTDARAGSPCVAGCTARRAWRAGRRAVRAFAREEAGQDLIEYALLTALISVIAIGVWMAMQGHLRTTYQNHNSGVQNLSDPRPPSGGSTH